MHFDPTNARAVAEPATRLHRPTRWWWRGLSYGATFVLAVVLLYPCLRDLLAASAAPLAWAIGCTLPVAIGAVTIHQWRRANDSPVLSGEPVAPSPHGRVRVAILAALAMVLSFAGLAHWDRTEHARRVAYVTERIHRARQPLLALQSLARSQAPGSRSGRTAWSAELGRPDLTALLRESPTTSATDLEALAAQCTTATTAALDALESRAVAAAEATGVWRADLMLGWCGLLLLVGLLFVEPIVRIVRQQHATTLAQRERVSQLAAVAQHTHNAVVITDKQRRITWVNEGFRRLTGYSLAEVAGKSPAELLQTPDTDPATIAAMHAALASGEAFRGELQNRGKHGRSYWLALEIQPLRDARGEIDSFLAIQTDITERRRTEQELLEAKARAETSLREIEALRHALDEHSIISVADGAGRILDANTGFVRISGYRREELIGQDHRILNSGVQGKEFWAQVWRTITTGTPWRGEVCNRRKDGSLYWVDSTIVPVLDNGGRIAKYVSIRFDITAQKSDAAALVTARAQAEAANAAKSEFLANMSHEIRTPMNAILGYTDLLRDAPQNPEVAQALEVIQRNGRHLLVILNDILDLSKIEAGRLAVESVRFPLAPMLNDIVNLMRSRAAEKHLVLHVTAATPMPRHVTTDPTRLRQILANLVGNAIKFTERGTVQIVVSCTPAEAMPRQLRILVQDTGIGMSPNQLELLFRPFTQADTSVTRRFGGTGLGLAISQRLASMLGGAIRVASEPGAGTTFCLTLDPGPLAADDYVATLSAGLDAATEATAGQAPPLHDRPIRILVAEDGPDNQRLFRAVLTKAGHDFLIVGDGEQACVAAEQAAATGHPFEVIVMDMQMPVLDGYGATRRLRDLGLATPVIACTAHAMAEDRDKCLAAGCVDVTTKPIDRRQLLAKIAHWASASATAPVRPEPHP